MNQSFWNEWKGDKTTGRVSDAEKYTAHIDAFQEL